jgi:hypothetical protein
MFSGRQPVSSLDLTRSRNHRVLGLVDVAARQPPDPLIDHEPVPPHHQDLALVDDGNESTLPQSKHVLLEGDAVGKLDLDDAQSTPPAVVHHALAVNLSPRSLADLARLRHGPNASSHARPTSASGEAPSEARPPAYRRYTPCPWILLNLLVSSAPKP